MLAHLSEFDARTICLLCPRCLKGQMQVLLYLYFIGDLSFTDTGKEFQERHNLSTTILSVASPSASTSPTPCTSSGTSVSSTNQAQMTAISLSMVLYQVSSLFTAGVKRKTSHFLCVTCASSLFNAGVEEKFVPKELVTVLPLCSSMESLARRKLKSIIGSRAQYKCYQSENFRGEIFKFDEF